MWAAPLSVPVSETKRALSPPHSAGARTSIVRARGGPSDVPVRHERGPLPQDDARRDRQYNRRIPPSRTARGFRALRPHPKWPEPVKWYRGRDENARPKLPFREDARGDDVSFAPKWDPSLTLNSLAALATTPRASRIHLARRRHGCHRVGRHRHLRGVQGRERRRRRAPRGRRERRRHR